MRAGRLCMRAGRRWSAAGGSLRIFIFDVCILQRPRTSARQYALMADRVLRKLLIGSAVAVLAAVAVGVLAGHFLWGGSSAARRVPSGSRSFGAFEYPRVREGIYGYGGAGRPRFYEQEGVSPAEEEAARSGGSSSSSQGAVGSVASKVDPGLVDINTVLGLEGGAAAGTGMVVTANGEVMTNNHVITGATSITATDIGNGKTYTAHVVGYDYGHDIAVLQLEGASGLKTVKLGNSAGIKVGESVVTIGNAGGRGGTPTAVSGKIAGLNRSITAGDEIDGTEEHLSNMIEIEGDLEPGDSGGPLVNSSGEVLGMDTAASQTFQLPSSANEGFAIPIDEVKSVAGGIVSKEAASTVHIGATGFLGVLVEARSSGGGALVENVISGTPAASSGLTAGDYITEVDGSEVSSPTALSHLILQHHPGERVKFGWRTPSGQKASATVTLAEGPPQ